MLEIIQSETFVKWLTGLRDSQARARIHARIDRLIAGNPGDVKPVRQGITEMRIHQGPGYRLYYTQRGATIIVLLCGSDKRTQNRDIQRAIEMAADWRD